MEKVNTHIETHLSDFKNLNKINMQKLKLIIIHILGENKCMHTIQKQQTKKQSINCDSSVRLHTGLQLNPYKKPKQAEYNHNNFHKYIEFTLAASVLLRNDRTTIIYKHVMKHPMKKKFTTVFTIM
jgi:hypothetical protein